MHPKSYLSSYLSSYLCLLFCFLSHNVSAHPGSGIVVDDQGQVFFQDSIARTIWKIDAQGKLTAFHDKLGGHWMALDVNGKFARSELKLVERITPVGATPALLVADGGAPLAVSTDGYLYYGLGVSLNSVAVGLTKISPEGKQESFAPPLAQAIENLGITGIAAGPGGSLYIACLTQVMKLNKDGGFTNIANLEKIKDCDQDAPTTYLRGLDADESGNLYVAACGCRSVVKIRPNRQFETLLKAERPWSPTGVAAHHGDVYILEYTNPNGAPSEGWLPRVRKISRDGKVTTIATISQEQQNHQPRRLILEPPGQ